MNKAKILLVDDEPTIRVVLSAVLESQGYFVESAEDGFAALRKIRSSLPDLIISDLRMPNMNGFELLGIVRKDFPQIPVIAISGEFVGERVEGILADAFFQKGHYAPLDLLHRVSELLEKPRSTCMRKERAPVWAPTGDSPVMVTCTNCLKSFPIDPCDEGQYAKHEVQCIFCGAVLHYELLAITRSA